MPKKPSTKKPTPKRGAVAKPKPLPKRKAVAKSKPLPKHKAAAKPKPAPARKTKAPPMHSEEYVEYLERHELLGRNRPKLTPAQFDQYDDELLDLLALEMERGLDDDQTIRVKELEYLLIDSEQ